LNQKIKLNKKTIKRNIANQVIHCERLGNSNWQIGHMAALSSISIAQEGHSFFFKSIGFELFAAKIYFLSSK
jgi:hypothetical protein